MVAVLPDRDVELAAALRRWDDTRRELARLLDDAGPDHLRGGVFRHPVSGWISVEQVVRFFAVHMHHHGFQLARLAAASEGS